MLTVSPNRQYLGILTPTTPAQTGPGGRGGGGAGGGGRGDRDCTVTVDFEQIYRKKEAGGILHST